MLASPSDVNDEREIARKIIWEWNYLYSIHKKMVLLPIGWETHSAPLLGDRPQEIINKQVLGQSDLLIGIFWTRIGTPTGNFISGSAEEIEAHIKTGKPVMLYFSNKPVALDRVDNSQYQKLIAFKNEYMQRGLIETFSSIEDFKNKFERQLAIMINTTSYFKGFEEAGVIAVQNGEPIAVDKYINRLADVEQRKLKLSVKPKLWLNGASTNGASGDIKIDLNNKGETAYIKDIKLLSGNINLHSLSLPYELNKSERRYIFGRTTGENHISNTSYTIEVSYEDELGNKFISIIEGVGPKATITKTIEN
ncbi:hypothetical protein [Rhodocytophaga aerolata]